MISISNKDVIWNYLGYGISIGLNLILLPLVLQYLTAIEVGLWYIFTNIGALITLFDFGFAPQMARSVTYAYSGARTLNKIGLSNAENNSPNFELLTKVVISSKMLYSIIAYVALIILLTIGSYYIYKIHNFELSNNLRLSWVLFCFGSFINLRYSFYNSVYRGVGLFVVLNKAMVVSKVAQLILSLIFLVLGYGILAVSVAYILSSVVFRVFFYIDFNNNKIFKEISSLKNSISFTEKIDILKLIWYNASKDGMVTISNYLVVQSNTILCSLFFGLEKTASYALSVQIVTLVASVSLLMYSSFQPLIVNASVINDFEAKKKYFSLSWASYFLTFLLLITLVITIGFPLLEYIKSNTKIDLGIFLLYSFYILIQTNTNLSASYISTSNKLPYAFPFMIFASLAVICAVLVGNYTSLGVYGLILSHFLIHCTYNAWKWPYVVFQDLRLKPHLMIVELFNLIRKKK